MGLDSRSGSDQVSVAGFIFVSIDFASASVCLLL